MKNLFICITASIFLSGCAAGTSTYVPSNQTALITTSIDVNRSKDSTWNQLVVGLSSSFFAINTMDNKSGFINLNYAADPEKYIEGGEFSYTIHTPHPYSPTTDSAYRFPASRANTVYETVIDNALYEIHRQLDLKGKMNIVVSEISPNRSRLTVNINYILNLKVTGYKDYHETISFMSGQSAKSSLDSAEYRSNGKLEQTILDMVK